MADFALIVGSPWLVFQTEWDWFYTKSISIERGWYQIYQFDLEQANASKDLSIVLISVKFGSQISNTLPKSGANWYPKEEF